MRGFQNMNKIKISQWILTAERDQANNCSWTDQIGYIKC